MPKERRDRSVSRDRYRASPFPCSSSCEQRTSSKTVTNTEEDIKEWEDARCPVCIEHPHNAVLLLCSSHEKGCRPYMCDTSYRHSNCLDQFCKSFQETSPLVPLPEDTVVSDAPPLDFTTEAADVQEELEVRNEETLSTVLDDSACLHEVKPKIVCPLCRGEVKEWVVVDAARRYMNSKARSCANEVCDFNGTYTDLRKHARVSHPSSRPSEADPERERNWRRLERQRDLGDLLSTLQSSFGEEEGDNSILSIDEGGWLTVFFLIRVFRPGSTSRSGTSWSGTSRARGQLSVRRRSTRLWGETYENDSGTSSRRSTRLWGETFENDSGTSSRDEENNESSDDNVSGRTRRSVRRRTTPDDQS